MIRKVFAALAFLSFVYVGFLAYVTRLLLFPSGVYGSSLNVLPPCQAHLKNSYVYCGDPRTDFGFEFESFSKEKSIKERKVGVSGWWVRSKLPPKGVVILVHGDGDDRRAMLKHLSYLSPQGFDVALIDTHNHGLAFNSGTGTGFGHWESESVLLTIDWVKERSPGPIYLLGTATGAVAALRAAARSHDVKAVVAENPPSSVERLFRQKTLLPPELNGQVVALLSLWHGADLFELAAKHLGPKIKIPVFVIHGSEDRELAYQNSQEFSAALAGPKDFWLAPYAEHRQIWNKHREEYEARVLKFFHAALETSAASKSAPFQGTVK